MLRQIEPGKARSKFNEKMWNSPNYVAECKLDGFRVLTHVESGQNRLTTRRKSVKNGQFVEKSDNFPQIRDLFFDNRISEELEGCVFDGEIIWGKNSMDITTISGCLPDKAVSRQLESGFADYYVFDILYDKGRDIRHLPYETRRNILSDYLESIVAPKNHLYIVPAVYNDKKQFYDEIISEGGEGIILKDIGSPYASDWVKVKRKATWDVIITNFKEPKEITKKVSGEESVSKFFEKGWIGAINFGQWVEGTDGNYSYRELREFGFCSGMNDALREQISKNRDAYIGKVIEIEAQERLPSGKFRHPRFLKFRPDKNPEQCVYREGEA